MSKAFLKFGLFGSGLGGTIGLGVGAYYGGALGATAGMTCGLILGPPALLVTAIAVSLACVAAAAAIAVPCFLGYQLMKAVLIGCAIGAFEAKECCFPSSKY